MTEPLVPRDEREQLVRELADGPVRSAINGRERWWRQPWVWCFGAGALLVAVLLILMYCGNRSKDREIDSLSGQVSHANNGLAAVASQVRSLGGTPVATPSAGSGPQGPRGLRGAAGSAPSAAQINAAVASYCAARSGCVGVPSKAQVASAVRAYCAAGVCRGARGAAGASGSPGQPGADGADGSSPSTADIAAAVSAYCSAHDDCTGPAGPKGDTGSAGAKGDTGVGIASLDCTGLALSGASITVHWTDGTSTTVVCTATPTSGAPSS